MSKKEITNISLTRISRDLDELSVDDLNLILGGVRIDESDGGCETDSCTNNSGSCTVNNCTNNSGNCGTNNCSGNE